LVKEGAAARLTGGGEKGERQKIFLKEEGKGKKKIEKKKGRHSQLKKVNSQGLKVRG